MDIWTKKKRSAVMARILAKNTKPEIAVRRLLRSLGYRFQGHRKDLPGKPDIVIKKDKKIIFVHGCFWHFHSRCIDGKMPKSRIEYWQPKLERNVKRDKSNGRLLKKEGWKVLKLWECEIEKKVKPTIKKINKFLSEN